MSLKKFDIAKTRNDARVLHLVDFEDRAPLYMGEGETKPVTISFVGKDSDTFIKGSRIIRNKQVERAKKKVTFSAAEQDAESIELIARCATGWGNVPICWLDGSDSEEPVEFSYSNAVKLFTRQAWIFEQGDEFVGGRENLLKASPKN